MILDHDALEALRSKIATLGITSLSDDDPTETEYMWALVQDLTEARAELAKAEKDLLKLECLEGCGVDNWEGYDDAMADARKALATKGRG